MREKQLESLNNKLKRFSIKPIEDEQIKAFGFKAKLKQFLYQAKILFYKFARFSIVIVVLLFMTQSNGVLSALYCLFCLVFIYRENSILYNPCTEEEKKLDNVPKNLQQEKTTGLNKIKAYSRLLSHFLRLILFDLILQMIIQFPFELFIADAESWRKESNIWFKNFGLFKLYGDKTIEKSTESTYESILFKIFTFTFLLMVQAMMNSKDFEQNHSRQCDLISKDSEKIGLKLSQEFNRKRIYMSKLFNKSKKIFNCKGKSLRPR